MAGWFAPGTRAATPLAKGAASVVAVVLAARRRGAAGGRLLGVVSFQV